MATLKELHDVLRKLDESAQRGDLTLEQENELLRIKDEARSVEDYYSGMVEDTLVDKIMQEVYDDLGLERPLASNDMSFSDSKPVSDLDNTFAVTTPSEPADAEVERLMQEVYNNVSESYNNSGTASSEVPFELEASDGGTLESTVVDGSKDVSLTFDTVSPAPSASREPESDIVDKKLVIFRLGNQVCVVGSDLDNIDFVYEKSTILKNASSDNLSVKFYPCAPHGIYNVCGVRVNVHDDGVISVNGEADEIEFYNQEERIINTRIEKVSEKAFDLDKLLFLIHNNKISSVQYLFKTVGPETIWKAVHERLDNKSMDESEFRFMVEYLTSNYDRISIIDDRVFKNAEYEKILEKYPIEKKLRGKKVKRRKEPKKSLMQKFKDLKTWQKAVIVAGGVAAGVGAFVFGPTIIANINDFVARQFGGNDNSTVSNGDLTKSIIEHEKFLLEKAKELARQMSEQQRALTDVTSQVSQISFEPAVSVSSLDYSSIGQGHQVFANAYDAVTGNNALIANAWFNGNPLDVFNTASNSFMHLTQEQLHNADLIRDLAQDPNNTLLMGSSLMDPDGFVSLADVFSEIVKGGKVL